MQKFSLYITLDKKNDMIYTSQLDVLRILERALRRTGLPLYFTQGFNPHVKISFHKGLKLGVEGQIEAQLYFTEEITEQQLKDALSTQLPEGLEIL